MGAAVGEKVSSDWLRYARRQKEIKILRERIAEEYCLKNNCKIIRRVD